jgi:GH25 family lysozyme M1 (1,4-beta-N-acetylmuramidase)
VRHPLSAPRRARSVTVAVTALAAFATSALAYADGGVDLSHYQGSVSWSKVRSDGISFAFMKATEGSTYADPTLQRNWQGAEQVGIYRSAYHFARPSTGTAAAQARFFVAKAGRFADPGDLPPVLDLEASGGLGPAALRSWVSTWLTTVERLTGRTPILYFSPSFWTDHMGNSTAFTRYPLWIANYTTGAPRVPGGWPTWTFWQRTSSGRVSGISGSVDMNRFNGTTAALARLANVGGGTTAPVPPGPTLPAGAATTLSLVPATTTPTPGATVRFTGRLQRTSPAGAVASRAVALWTRTVGGTWTKVSSATTTSTGAWSLSAPVGRAADYQARFAGDATYAATVSTATRVSPALAPTALDLRKDKVTVGKGAPLMLYGHLTSRGAGLTGGVVRYYKRYPTSTTWTYVSSSSSKAPTGWHSMVAHPRVDRVWKAVYSGSSTLRPVTSSLLTVHVR